MKTWEMIRELAKNPKKQFKNQEGDKVIVDNGVVKFSNGEIFELNFKGYNANYYFSRVGTIDNYEWEEVKQPVSWQEAIEAWLNGKDIYYTFNDSKTFIEGDKIYFKTPYRPLSKDEISEAKWYIEN